MAKILSLESVLIDESQNRQKIAFNAQDPISELAYNLQVTILNMYLKCVFDHP